MMNYYVAVMPDFTELSPVMTPTCYLLRTRTRMDATSFAKVNGPRNNIHSPSGRLYRRFRSCLCLHHLCC